jgi:dTDP-4-amino-4,6-dideoxy-D-galactose acyltransferase
MKPERLVWDSDFFKLRIGKLSVEKSDEDNRINSWIQSQTDFDLLYIFCEEYRFLTWPEMDTRCKLVDRKIIFKLTDTVIQSKSIRSSPSIEIRDYDSTVSLNKLRDLAFQSGVFSRFFTDLNFQKEDFYRLYSEWIEKSIAQVIADRVFVAYMEDALVGMVTVKWHGMENSIGLFAVSEGHRGQGIGSLLMDKVLLETNANNTKPIVVATQLQNELACNFYNRYGFDKHQVTNIYHFWYNPRIQH